MSKKEGSPSLVEADGRGDSLSLKTRMLGEEEDGDFGDGCNNNVWVKTPRFCWISPKRFGEE
jgi:hypothetical protein